MKVPAVISRLLASTPLHTEVAVSKVFDLAEEVYATLERTGHSPEWLAEQVGITPHELADWLGGMHPILDNVARLEAALRVDLLVAPGRPQGYFGSQGSEGEYYFEGQAVDVVLPSNTEPRTTHSNYLTVSVRTEHGERSRRYNFVNAA